MRTVITIQLSREDNYSAFCQFSIQVGSIQQNTLWNRKTQKKRQKNFFDINLLLLWLGFTKKRSFRRNGLTSNDCLPYEILKE